MPHKKGTLYATQEGHVTQEGQVACHTSRASCMPDTKSKLHGTQGHIVCHPRSASCMSHKKGKLHVTQEGQVVCHTRRTSCMSHNEGKIYACVVSEKMVGKVVCHKGWATCMSCHVPQKNTSFQN